MLANTAIREMLRTLPPCRYGYDYDQQTERVYRGHGAATIIVTVAGFKLAVLHHGATLVSIRPTATSAGRGECVLYPYDNPPSYVQDGYHSDPCPRPKVGKAIRLAFTAWQVAKGDVNAFYRALGERGFCAICGATLTDPLSRARGIGPECYKKIWGGERAVREAKAELAGAAAV